MNDSRKGFIVPIILIVVALLIAGGGAYLRYRQENKLTQQSSETVGWKTYTDSKVGFTFQYPSNASENAKEGLAFRVTVNDLNTMGDAPLGYGIDNALKDKNALSQGDPSVPLGMPVAGSLKMLTVKSALAKELVLLQELDVCDVRFDRQAVIYKDHYQIILSWSYNGADALKGTDIQKNNPSYFGGGECSKSENIFWTYKDKRDSSADVFYADLVAGKTDPVSQNWFTAFDKIVKTFQFTNVEVQIAPKAPSNETAGWKTYMNTSDGYSISYPDSYHVAYGDSLFNYDENKYERGNPNGVKIQVQRHSKENFGYDLATNEGVKKFTDKLNADRIKNDAIESSNSTPITPSSLGIFKFKNKVLGGPGGAFDVYYTFASSDTYYMVLVWGETNDQQTVNQILSTIKISVTLTTQPPIASEIPNIIKNITVDAETGSQKPENNSQVIDQVRKDVQNGKLLWFKDPVEVSKKYGIRFGIGAGAQYVLGQKAITGGDSGLGHSTVLATYNSKSYRIALITELSQPSIWVINAVTDVQQENKLRVNFFQAASTYDNDGVGHQEIVSKFGDGTTMYYLNVKNPVVSFYLNQPANPSTVNSGSIIVKVNNTVLSGTTAKAVTEQASSHGATFPMYSVQVDLSGVANLKNYAGQNIQIILTDKIKDNSGNPLQQCDRAYNKGECITDTSGQKIKVFGAELKLYSQTPLITVLSPNGGEAYRAGDTVNIRWSSNSNTSNSVNIRLHRIDETATTDIAKGVQNKGSYSWTVPQSNPGDSIIPYIVCVSVPDAQGVDNIDNKNADCSDNKFTITSAQTIQSSSLNSGTISVRAIVANINEVGDKYGSYGMKFSQSKLAEVDQALQKLNVFVQQSSYGKTQLQGNTMGVYELGSGVCNHTSYGDRVDDLIQRALQKADAQTPFVDYSYYLIVHPMPDCPDGSLWTFEGKGQFVLYTLNGRTVHLRGIHISDLSDEYLFHEFGHSLAYQPNTGIGHPDYINCPVTTSGGVTTIALSNSCPHVYDWNNGNIPVFTMMSAKRGILSDYSAIEKEIIGWLVGSDFVITTSGQYSLSPIEQSGPGPKALKIPISGTDFTAYVSFRQPVGYTYPDAPSNKPNGVTIDISSAGTKSFLVTNNVNMDAPLQIGASYRIGTSGPFVTVTNISNNLASVTLSSIALPR
ncbi:MAG: Ser-Thr-rich GPI-anchored membrane family protein [bacterium]|nr:Ser-Thr-rich GPI-anchored membrane family protein [bacterium]